MHRLSERTFHPDPVQQFRRWFRAVERAGVPEPNAMTLATATPSGLPSARMVLLKGVDPRGFCFFTNYESRKARELAANPHAALMFYWHAAHRQVRITGRVTKLPAAESDAYFATRPRESRLAALASRQSTVIESRAVLESALCRAGSQVSQHSPAASHKLGRLLCPSRRNRILAASPAPFT